MGCGSSPDGLPEVAVADCVWWPWFVQAPSYGETLEEQGRFTAKTVLPFNAYGTLALSHPADDVNGGEVGQRERWEASTRPLTDTPRGRACSR